MNRRLEEAERRAESHRTAFALAIEELDRRRKLAVDVRYQLRTHAAEVVLLAGAICVGATVWVVARRASDQQRRRQRTRELARGLARAYQHPEHIAVRVSDQPIWGRLARKVVFALVGTVVTGVTRKTARILLERTLRLERPRTVSPLPAG